MSKLPGREVGKGGKLDGAAIVIWTTTPWTMPGNRALAYGPEIAYALVECDGSQPRDQQG
jgi:isoleucyl-tRNA synthetase